MRRTMWLVTAILLPVMCAMAADVSGKWTGTMSDDRSSDVLLLILQQDGNKITGTGGPNESERHPLENVMLQGDKLTFEVRARSEFWFLTSRSTESRSRE